MTHIPAAALAIGQTPCLRLHTLAARHGIPDSIEIWLKMEWANPGGSVKDRPALAIIQSALETGQLTEGKTLIDSTSGNTGISYAMLGAAYGFPVEIVLPASASGERKQILAVYGAHLTESDALEGSDGAIRLVQKIVAADPDRYFFADQYGNPANAIAHFEGTGPEIWRQTSGRITHFVAALGTTGTMMGTGRYLRLANAGIRLIGVQPADPFHGIEGLKHLPTAIVPPIYDPAGIDTMLPCDTDRAYDLTRELARSEGLFAGTSTGASLSAAIATASEMAAAGERGLIVAVAPDGGSKYLSTQLWSGFGPVDYEI
jgi:cysteine synthase B